MPANTDTALKMKMAADFAAAIQGKQDHLCRVLTDSYAFFYTT